MALVVTSELRGGGLHVRHVRAGDREPVCASLSAALASGPVADWLIPDRLSRAVVYGAYARILFDRALRVGWIYTTRDQLGAAVWHTYPDPIDGPPGGDGPGDVVSALADAVPDERVWTLRDAASRFRALEEVVAGCVPDEPHERLVFVGVHPTVQRRGIGTRLLADRHRCLDEAGTPAFLVATCRPSRNLFGRHGYAVRARVRLPEGPEVWAMWRDPAPMAEVGS